MDKTDRLRDYGLAFLLYKQGLSVCGYELIRELFIFIKLILNSYLIKNLENKIKLVLILCSLFLVGCVVISLGSIWTARTMVDDAQKKIYVLDGNVPILVNRSTMEETLDVEAKSHVEMFHHYFFTLAPDDKYIKYTMEKAMYLIDESGLAQYNFL